MDLVDLVDDSGDGVGWTVSTRQQRRRVPPDPPQSPGPRQRLFAVRSASWGGTAGTDGVDGVCFLLVQETHIGRFILKHDPPSAPSGRDNNCTNS